MIVQIGGWGFKWKPGNREILLNDEIFLWANLVYGCFEKNCDRNVCCVYNRNEVGDFRCFGKVENFLIWIRLRRHIFTFFVSLFSLKRIIHPLCSVNLCEYGDIRIIDKNKQLNQIIKIKKLKNNNNKKKHFQ